MNICLFTQEELGRPLSVRDGRAAHILKVLRKTEGDSFAAGVVGGAAGTAVITKIADGGSRRPLRDLFEDFPGDAPAACFRNSRRSFFCATLFFFA